VPPTTRSKRCRERSAHWKQLALGTDDRPVATERTSASVGHEQTFGENLRAIAQVEAYLLDQAEEVVASLRPKHVKAERVIVKICFGDFKTITRSMTFDAPTRSIRNERHQFMINSLIQIRQAKCPSRWH